MSLEINLYIYIYLVMLFPDTRSSLTDLSQESPNLSLPNILSISFCFFTLSGPLETSSAQGLWALWRTPWALAWLGGGLLWSRPRSSCWGRLRLGRGRGGGPARCAGLRVRAWHPALQGWRWARGGFFSSAAAGAPSPLVPRCPLWRHRRGRSASANGPATGGTVSPYESRHLGLLSACRGGGRGSETSCEKLWKHSLWFTFVIRL